jgi:hypothetical protein
MTEFREIAHCGGQIYVTTETTATGTKRYGFGIRNSRPYPASIFAVLALPQGIPIATSEIGWAPNLPSQSQANSTFTIFVGSDRESLFGRQCGSCNGYWRSKCAPSRWQTTCPYCGIRAPTHEFLTDGQLRYVEAACEHYKDALFNKADGEHVIDFDAISDDISKGLTPPSFYYAEQSQQCKFTCSACGDFTDILGHFGFCSCCGTRNNLALLKADLRACAKDLSEGRAETKILGDVISHFDSFGSDLTRTLYMNVQLSSRRREKAKGIKFHDLDLTRPALIECYDIDILEGLSDAEAQLARLLFLRRHVHEHNASVADQRYLDKSGDISVRLGQAIRETKENVGRLIGLLQRMANNLHRGFNELLPPEEVPIRINNQRTPED